MPFSRTGLTVYVLFLLLFATHLLSPTAHDEQLRERAGRPGTVELRRARGGGDRGRPGRRLLRE